MEAGPKGNPDKSNPSAIGKAAIQRLWERYPRYTRRMPPPRTRKDPAAGKIFSGSKPVMAESNAKFGSRIKNASRCPSGDAEAHHCHPAAKRIIKSGTIRPENPHPAGVDPCGNGQIFARRQSTAAGETIRRSVSVPMEPVGRWEEANWAGASKIRKRIPRKKRTTERLKTGAPLQVIPHSSPTPGDFRRNANKKRMFPSIFSARMLKECDKEEEIPPGPISTGLSMNSVTEKDRKSIRAQETSTASGLAAKKAAIPEMVSK